MTAFRMFYQRYPVGQSTNHAKKIDTTYIVQHNVVFANVLHKLTTVEELMVLSREAAPEVAQVCLDLSYDRRSLDREGCRPSSTNGGHLPR